MNDFWIAVSLSLVSGLAYLWFSVSRQEEVFTKAKAVKQAKPLLILPALFLLATPLGYYFWGNLDKQNSWQDVTERFSNIQLGKAVAVEKNGIQELLLALRTSIDQDPDNGQLWFILAENYFQLGMTDLADAAMQKALTIEPRPSWFVANAQILSARSSEADLTKSVSLLRRALSIQPNHQSALLTLGFIYLRQQQFEKTVITWKKLQLLLEQSGNDTQMIKKQIEFAEQQLTNNIR